MKSLSRLLSPERIVWLVDRSKNECLRAMVHCLANDMEGLDPEEVYQAILEREKLLSTGFGHGLAIPHAKLKGLRDFRVALGVHKTGVAFDSFDEKPVRVLVMILAPEGRQEDYLHILRRVTAFLKDKSERVLALGTSEEIYELTYDY